MTRKRLGAAILWTLACTGLSFLWSLSQAGHCDFGDTACAIGQANRRQVFLVASPLIWLAGMLFFLWPRKR